MEVVANQQSMLCLTVLSFTDTSWHHQSHFLEEKFVASDQSIHQRHLAFFSLEEKLNTIQTSLAFR